MKTIQSTDSQALIQRTLTQALDQSGMDGGARFSGGLALGALDQPALAGCLNLEGSVRRSSAVGALVYRASDQSVANAAWIALSFNGLRCDPEGMFAGGAPTRLTCPLSGLYLAAGNAVFAANASGIRLAVLKVNGAAWSGGASAAALSGADTHLSAAALLSLNEGDYIEFLVYQSSGGALALRGGEVTACQLGLVRLV